MSCVLASLGLVDHVFDNFNIGAVIFVSCLTYSAAFEAVHTIMKVCTILADAAHFDISIRIHRAVFERSRQPISHFSRKGTRILDDFWRETGLIQFNFFKSFESL